MKTEPTEALSIKRANFVDKYLPPGDEQRYYQRLEMHEELFDLTTSHSPKIKQLEWAEGFFALLSDTPFGIYQILKPAGTHSAHIIYLNDKPILIVSDLNEAKSEAHKHFEKTVMGCLE